MTAPAPDRGERGRTSPAPSRSPAPVSRRASAQWVQNAAAFSTAPGGRAGTRQARPRRARLAWPIRLCVVGFLPALALADGIDTDTGLVTARGWEDVRAHCGGCHAYHVVTNQRANRNAWRDMIRWMQRTQNLWQIPDQAETRILDYLADNYGPDEAARQRRAPLAEALMPSRDG